MKNFPFKILIICILLPPVCYVLTIQALERYFQTHEASTLQQILIKNNDALYEGRYTVQEEIYNNIGEYLNKNLKYKLGVRINILVKTRDDKILYPTQFSRSPDGTGKGFDFDEGGMESLNYVEVAAENFDILNKGIIPSVHIEIRQNSLMANGILLSYVFLSFFFLQRVIKRRLKEAKAHEEEQESLIQRYSEQLKGAKQELEEIEEKESDYVEKIGSLREEKKGLSRDLDDLMEEMERLESGLDDQRKLKEDMELEVLQLKEELERVKGKIRGPKKKKLDVTGKRFKVLYKNLAFTERAIEGFNDLIDEFQLKAEEVIHKLNEDESLVPVKRKVFGKGGKTNVLEVDFSYSGRIYFQKDSNPKIKVVSIGTKNTQEQDLAYIESLK